jgi:hypothetical protein
VVDQHQVLLAALLLELAERVLQVLRLLLARVLQPILGTIL